VAGAQRHDLDGVQTFSYRQVRQRQVQQLPRQGVAARLPARLCARVDADPEVVCLFVKLVDNGVYVYNETFEEQAARAERTWGKYTDVVLSPMVAKTLGTYVEMRERERAAAAPLVQDILEQIRSGRAADLAERA
jgi:hypothetical protein